MPQILADAAMVKQLEEATGPVLVVNEQGTTIGQYTPIKYPNSPYSREEIEERRREWREHPERGKSLTEVMAYLHQLGGENP